MGFNVSASTTYQTDNLEILRSTAKNILNRGGASADAAQQIIEKTLFENNTRIQSEYINPQMSVIKASTQISLNNSLKETLDYIKRNAAAKVRKEPVLGELWSIFSTTNQFSEKNPYKGELYDFEIDKNAKNIFAA